MAKIWYALGSQGWFLILSSAYSADHYKYESSWGASLKGEVYIWGPRNFFFYSRIAKNLVASSDVSPFKHNDAWVSLPNFS